MIAGLDSAFAPTPAQVQAASAGGIRLWNGYLATKPNVGLLNPWTQAEFEVVRVLGSTPIGYCSGNDDPAAVKALAATWRVRPCLDVEGGIRPDGLWVQGWLDNSGAGLYGLPTVHLNRTAAFHVMSLWPGSDPGATWPSSQPKPNVRCGWQWEGGHPEFGANVDRCWFDDSFLGEDMTPEEHDDLIVLSWRLARLQTGILPPPTLLLSDGKTTVLSAIDQTAPTMPDLLAAIKAVLPAPTGGTFTGTFKTP
jgi:hypothetical protein